MAACSLLRASPVTLNENGDAEAPSAAASVDGIDAKAMVACPEAMQPYDIEKEQCSAMATEGADKFGFALFQKYAECHLLNGHIFHSNAAQDVIGVEVVENSEPMVWLARA